MSKKTTNIIKGNKNRVKPSEYLKNVTKSVAYISLDTVSGMNPAIKNLADSNSDVSKMIYETVKDYKAVLRNVKTKIVESDYYKIGKSGFENAIDDLKTGKFYNKEREDAIDTKLTMGGDGDDFFDDFNMDDFDFNFDDDEEDEVIDKGDKLIAKEIDSSSRALAGSIGSTTIESAKYLADTQKASTRMLYDQNNRLLGSLNLGMGTVSASVQQIVAYQEKLNTHIENSTTFFGEMTSQMKTTNELLVKIVENQEKAMSNGELEDNSKERMTYSDIDDGMGGVSLKNYFKYIVKNAKGMSGGVFDLLSNTFSGGNILESFAASPWKMVTEAVINKAIPEMIKEATEELNKSVTGLFAGLQGLLSTLPGGEDSKLYQLLHIDNSIKSRIDTSKYHKEAQAWNGIDHKALTEVIPDQLSEIISLLSGKDKRLFDYDKGQYVNVTDIKKQFEKDYNQVGIKAGSDLMQEMKAMFREISFDSKDFEEGLTKAMEDMFAKAAKNGTFFNVWDPNFDLTTELGVDPRYKRHLQAALKATNRSTQMEYNLKQREAIANWNNNMKKQELENSIYRYIFDNSELTHIKTDKQGRVIHDKDQSLIGTMSLDRQKDNLGHNVFYYLQNINKELTYIRQSNKYTAGAGGRGRYGRSIEIVRTDIDGNEKVVRADVNSKKLSYDDIKLEDKTADEYKRELDREAREAERYTAKQDKRREKNPNIVKSEDLDDLDDKHFDRSYQNIAEEVRERDRLAGKKAKLPHTFSTLDELVKAETFSEKVKVINDNFKALLHKPADILASAMQAADKAIYTLVYGDKRDKDGKRKGFMREMMDQMKLSFLKFHDWMDGIFEPLKEKLGVDQFREVPGKIFEHFFGMTPHEAYVDFKSYLFGEFEEDADGNKYRIADGLLTGLTDGIKEAFNDTGEFLKETFKPIKDFIDGKKKDKTEEEKNDEDEDTDEEYNSVGLKEIEAEKVDPKEAAKQLINEKKNRRRRELDEKREKLQEELGDRIEIDDSNASLFINDLFDDERMDIEKVYKKLKNHRKGYKELTKQEYYTKRDALEAILSQKNDTADFLDSFISKNRDNKKYANNLYSFLLANNYDINDLTMEDLMGILSDKNNVSALNGDLRRYIKSASKENSDVLSMNLKQFRDFVIQDYGANHLTGSFGKVKTPQDDLMESLNSPQDVAKGLLSDDAINDIADVFMDPLEESIGISENIENILEDILDAVRSIHPANQPEKRPRFMGSKRYHDSYDMLDAVHAGEEEIESEAFDDINGMAYGGRVVKSGPVILSEGEYVFNPADAKTKKRQAANEARIAKKLGLQMQPRMAEGEEVKFDDSSIVTADHLVDNRKINGRNRDIYRFGDYEYYEYKRGKWKRVDDDNTIYIRPKDTNSMSEWNPKKFKNRKAKMIQDVEDGKYEEGEEPLAYKMYETTANAANQVFRSIGISKDDEDALGKATADVMHNIKEYAPYMIGTGLIGGGVSLITGLVGGPLLGAASGAAIGLIKKSDKVQDWLFGEIGEDGSRQGGVISKDLQDKVSKYLPDMAKGGVLGGTAGLLTQLFTPLGPVGGIMVGSAIGFAKNNEEIKKTLFGDNWEENSKKFKDKLKSLVPGLAVGALAGIGGLGGSLGLFPAAIIGTLGGWAASTEKMKRLLFGKLQEDGTRDNTGLFGAIKVGIVDPIKENSKKLFDDIRKWVKDDIISPVKRSIDPIFKFVTNIGGTVLGFLGDKIGESLDHGITAVFAKYLKDNVIGKTAKKIGWVGNQLLSPAKFVISSPFRAIGAVGDHLRGRQVAKGQADYMTASERVQYRADHKNKKSLFGIGRKLRGDKFSKFDKFISTASDDQLYDLNGQLKEMIDPDNFYKKKSADAEAELRNTIYALNNGIEFKDAAKIEKAIKKGDYDKARTLIGQAPDLDPYTRDRLMHDIFEAGAEYNSVQKQREQLKTQGRLSLGVIRNMSGGIFKGLKSYKDLDKYKTYLNKEIDVRSQKSDVEEQTEVLEKQHKEVVDLFKFANDRLRALTDPEFAIELTNRERHEAMTAANKRYGSFSIRKRDKSTLMYDYRTNPETGDEEMTYIGPGSKWHKLEHADDYDENGEYKYHSLKGSHALANAKHGHWTGNNIKDIAFMYQQQGMSEDEALELARENYIGDDKKIFKGFIKRRLLTKQAHDEIQIINYAKDLAVANGKSEDDYEEFLDDARSTITRKFFGGVSRSGRKKAASLNYQVTRNAIRDKYAESMSDDDANELADSQMAEANKKPWYRFVGVKRFKMKVDQDGAPAIDTSDPSSIRNLQDVYKAEEVQSKTYTVISAIDNSITGFIHRLLGTGDEEEGKTPVWKKLLKGGLKVLGAWTVISMGPYLKKLWQDTIAPQISSSVGKVLAPVAPALENIALKLDNFFLNIFPNTVKNVARGAIGWLTGSGEYKNSGLPYVFKQHIIPFYMGGLEFLMEDIIPNTVGLFFKHLPTMLMNTASNLSKMWTWSLQDIIKGNYVKDNKASLSSKDIVNDIKNYEYKPKTGPFYGAYKSLFGSSSRNDLSGTSVETVNKSSTKNESGTETGQPSFKDKVKNFFGLNKTSEMYSNRGTSTSSTSTVKTKSVKQVAGGYNTTPSSNINYESYGTSPYVESYGGTMTSSGMYIPVYNDEPITTVEDNMNSYYAMQDESNYVVDEATGIAYMVDDNGNKYELDTEGAVWIQDANGEYIQVSTNQDFNWSAYDGLYHGYDEEGNEVALTTGQYFGRSMSNIAAGLYGSLQDNAAKGKGVLENIKIGAQRGHLGHAIIRSFVNGKAGILGGLSQVGAKRGIIGRTLTKPIRGIGKVVNAAGTAGDASRTALAQVTKWKREKAAQELAKKASEAERKKILNFAKTKKTVSSKIINNKTNKIIAEESTKAGNKAAREFLESKGLPLGQGLLDDSYTALSKADKKALKKVYKNAVQEAEKSATAKAAAKNLISNSTDDTIEHLAQVSYKSADNLIKEAGESLVESTSKKGLIARIAAKFKDVCCNKKVIGIISKVGGNFSESVWVQTIDKAGKKLAEEFGAKLLGKGVSKVASFLGKLSPIGIGFDILDFIRGMNEAQKNLAILRKPTFVEKILSGLITVINSHVTLGLMPETLIYDFLININPFGWFDSLQAERQEGQEFIELYNEANDTNYKSLGEYYNEKQKPWWKFTDKEEEYKEQQAKNRVDALVQYRQVREASTKYTTKSNLDYLSDVTVPSKPLPTTPQISKINYDLESRLNKNLEGGASGIKDTDNELYDSTYSGTGSGLAQYTARPNQVANSLQRGTFISQYDNQFANTPFNISGDTKKQTVADAGCGPASAAMVVNDALHGIDKTSKEDLDKNSLMNDSIKYALSNKYKVTDGGVVPQYFTDYFRSKGLNATKYSNSGDVASQIESGSRMVVLGQDSSNKSKENSPFGPNGHYVVVNGMSKDGQYVFVNDPELSVSNVPYSTNLFMKGVQLGIKAINKKSGYNVGKDFSSGKGTLYNDPNTAALYQDLCSWSSVSEAILTNTIKQFVKDNKRIKRPSNNILVRKAKIFLIAAKESELDPRFLVALACIISDYGFNEYVRTYNNPFGLKYKGEYLSFASIEDGIIEGAKFIKHFYYMRGERYSLIQMATNTYPDCKGDTYNPDNAKGWHIKVAKFMASRKMPNNSKAVLFTEGPKGTKDVIPEVTGKAVYDEGVNATSIITKISSIFSNMFNAVFGLSTDNDEEEGYVDADGEEAYLHANGHPFTCYCEECHPEMYDNGRPIHINSVLYQYAANRYYENAENNNTSANGKTGKDKYTKSQNETRDILSKVYELAGFSASDVSSYGITTQTFTDMNKYALSDAKEDMRVRSLYSKFFLLGGLYKKGLLDKDIQTPSNEVRPKLSKYASSKWKYNPGEDKSYADMASFAEILENDLDVFDVESKYEVTKKGVGLNINDAESLYNSMLMLYSKYSGSDYDVSGFGKSVNSSSYGTDVIGYVNRAKSIYNNIKANRPDIFGKIVSNLGYIPEGVKFSDSAYATKSDIERYKQEGTMISDKNVVSRKLLFEKTNTFNPMNVKDITITPYRKSSSFAPEFYLANATVTGKNSKAFMTKFLGIPVYGIGSIDDGAEPAWNIADYGDPYSDSYKNSYGNVWNVGPQVTEFRKQLGIGTEAKEPGKTRIDPYVEYRKKAIEKASKEGRPDKIHYYYHELLKKDGIDLDVSLKESTNRALPTFELKYLSPTGQLMNKTLAPDAKDKFYSDYYNATILLNKSNEESLGDDMELVTPTKVAVSMKDSALASLEAADKAVGNFFETQDSDYGNLVEDEAADGQGSGLGSFISQLDPRYANMRFNTSKDTVKQTLGEAGCAPAVATMAINNYTGGASMADMSKAALKYKVKNGGTSSDYFSDVFAKNGISSSYTTSQSDIKNSLKNGNSVVLLGQDSSNKSKANSPFGPGSHYVLANGISPDGKEIYVNDPELNGPATYSSKILRNTNLGVTVGGSSGLRSRLRTFIGGASKDVGLVIWNTCLVEGCTEAVAAAIIGNAMQESSLICDNTDGKAHGIFQWQGGRFTNLKNFAKSYGGNWKDPYIQVKFLFKEFNGGDPTCVSKLKKEYSLTPESFKKLTSIKEATTIFCKCFERAGEPLMEKRIKYAKDAYKKYSGKEYDASLDKMSDMSGDDSVDISSDSSGQKDSSVIGAFQSRVSNMFNAAFGIDSGSYTSSSSGGVFKSVDKSWVSIVKAVKKAMAKTIGYYQMGGTPQKITVNGKTIKARPDCSGFVSACLIIADVLSPGTFYSSSNFVDGSGGLEKKLNKAGFTKHSWNGWQALAKGDIIAKNGHVEIYSHTDKSGTHKVYNYGSKHSAPVPGVSTSAKKEYTVYWTKSGSGSLLVGLGSSLLSNINSSIRNSVRSRGSVNRFAGLGTVDKMIRLLSGKGYTKNEPKYTTDGKRSYVASGSTTNTTNNYTANNYNSSNTYDENYDMLDSSGAFMEYTYDGNGSKQQKHYHNIPVNRSGGSSRRSYIKNFNSYSNTSGYGTTNNYNSNYYNRELINSVGGASAIDPAIQALIATCAKYLASIAANSKQMKTIVTLLTKIATKSKSGSGSKVESGKGNKSNNSSSASSVIINNSSDDEFNDPGLEAMIRQLSELAE